MRKRQSVGRVVTKKRYEGRWMRLQEKQKSKTQTTTKSGPSQKSASRSAQGRKSILRSPSQGISQQAGAADSGTPEKNNKEKNNALQERIEVEFADLENRRRQIARSVQEKVRESYGFLPDECRSKKKCACRPYHNGKVVLLLPTH